MGAPLERETRGATTVWTFRVEQVYRGDLNERVEVVTASEGAACGLELELGERVGLLLERDGGLWRSGLCSRVHPRDFLGLTEVADNTLPEINRGGYIVGFLVLGLAVWLLMRRRRRYSGLR